MHNSLKTLAATAAGAFALASPAAALAQEAPKPGSSSPGDVPAETLQRMQAQRPLIKAADVVQDAIDAELAAKPDSGFTSLILGERSVVLRYKGTPSPGVQAAVDKARATAAVDVLDAKHSKHQLEQAAEKIKVKLKSDDAPTTVVLPAAGDKVRVEVKGDLKRTKHALPDTGDVAVDVVPGEEYTQTYGRMSDSAPYYGSSRINNAGGGSCTAGFGVTKGGRDYILTAGHCGSLYDRFYTGDWSRLMGKVAYRDSWHDTALIETSAGGYIYDSWIGSTAIRDVVGFDRVYPNEWLCAAGSVTGAICDIYADTSRVYSYCDSGWCYGDLFRGRQAQGRTITQPGDSGGPIYNLSGPNWSQAQAKGIISGRTDSTGSTVIFQDFWTANEVWGVVPK